MQTVVVVIVEEDGYRLGETLDEEAALTLVAVASEDPVCWDDVVAYWPRYRTPPVPEFADSLALERVDFAAARGTLERHESWVVIDLVRRRIITGRDMEPIGRDQAFAMVVEESGQQHFRHVSRVDWRRLGVVRRAGNRMARRFGPSAA